MAWVKAAYWLVDSKDKMGVEEIRVEQFSHLFCAFADLDRVTYNVVVQDYKKQPFRDFNRVLHAKKPSLKTILSIGGRGKEDPPVWKVFAAMARSPSTRAVFIKSSIQVAREYGFDGIDLDYEFPDTQDDMDNLGAVLAEWRAAVSASSPLLLTAAVIYKSINYHTPPVKYPITSIVANLDWINIMAYDFSSPVYEDWGSPTLTKPTAQLHHLGINGVNSWVDAGVPLRKIVLGVPFYGLAWVLSDPTNHGYDAPANGPSTAFGIGGDEVFYSRIMEFINNERAATFYDRDMVGNYCYKGNTWVSYDNVDAVQAKVKYIKEKGLLGYFGWQLAGDGKAFTLSTAAARAFDP